MKYLVFSDIHSNLEAFQAMLALDVIQDADKILFLGDLVGYGASPNEVMDLFRSLPETHYVRGNHDKVIADLESSALFNPVAAFSAEWSKYQLSDANASFLKEMPQGPLIIDRCITICHGSLFDEDFYLFSNFEAAESFKFMETSLGFFGHTHFPIVYLLRNDRIDTVPLAHSMKIRLDENTRYMINPGSVGQPRDRNPDPSFMILDTNRQELLFFRFTYPVVQAQKKILDAKLPEMLATRLQAGV